jgi:AcrR family transcriptional regulator
VAAPSVYPHFPHLDALVLELIRRHMGELAARVRAAVAQADGARAALRAAAHAYVRWGLERPGPYTVVFEGRALRQLSRDEELALTAGEDLLADLVSLLQAMPGAARADRDAARAALAVWSGLHGVVALRIAKPAYPWPPVEEHADAVIEPYLG